MFELEIGGNIYQFKFGMGFMREVNKKISQPVDGLADVKKNIGLQYTIAGILDGDIEELVNALDVANKGMSPRVTKQLLDEYIDSECEDIEKLFEDVIDFLGKANATKKVTKNLQVAIEEEKAKAKANNN